jgi:hypothetical protein
VRVSTHRVFGLPVTSWEWWAREFCDGFLEVLNAKDEGRRLMSRMDTEKVLDKLKSVAESDNGDGTVTVKADYMRHIHDSLEAEIDRLRYELRCARLGLDVLVRPR